MYNLKCGMQASRLESCRGHRAWCISQSEYLERGLHKEGVFYSVPSYGTDSQTTMINGLGMWVGRGRIEG